MTISPDPNEKLSKVFDCEQESEGLVVRGLLESAGIDTLMTAVDTDQELFPMGGVRIFVREEQANEARTLIEEYRADHQDEVSDASEVSEETE
jgi:hypothetical protein